MTARTTHWLVSMVALSTAVGCAAGGMPGGRRDSGPQMDAQVEIDAAVDDAGTDTGAPDADAPGDGGALGCTPATAAAVCGARPCVDGFCCDDACDGACRSCAVAGAEGTCTLHAEGSDPEAECAAEPAASCGTVGACDGAGACTFHPTGTGCDDGESCTATDACDGAGTCRGDAPTECSPGAGNECCLGSCAAGTGCTTTAGLCADRCDATQLAIGRSCLGCGGARAAGACMGGGVHTCDATSHSLCQQLSCGGVTYSCTNDGGTWQWRAAARCDDGDACTHSDACSAGACAGTAVACTSDACTTRSCNGTATCTSTVRTGVSCEDGDLCTRADTCSAAGACTGGPRTTCTDTACLDRECNGTAACTETPRTGLTCDDGNACTHGETCSGAGACGGGSTIGCDAMDTTCRDFSCNGTSTCASTPRTGTVCDDANPLTAGDVCRSDGTCMGVPGCALPTDACANGTQSRDRCAEARVIGRSVAGTSGGYVTTGDTCSASNRFDDCPWDAGNDHAYRVWMRSGESVSVAVSRVDTCYSSWSATLKLYQGVGCADVTCSGDLWCEDFVSSAPRTYVAPRDGWVVIVVDGSTSTDDEGRYTLTVRLTCGVGGCGC